MAIISTDGFAGGGGASRGIELATGRSPIVAINHWDAAIANHRANHPDTRHLCQDIFTVHPVTATRRRAIDLAWFSPDCTHFSRAKGAKPRSQKIRGLAWIAVEWATTVRPRVIFVENVPEFLTWCPLDDAGHPIKSQKGETFKQWVGALMIAGYKVEWRTLVAADYGAPTTRKRLFVIARCDGEPIVWPEPTHGPGRALPWRTAAECIDWSIPCPSIFTRKRPLAEATQRRIAEGLRRYVLESPEPYIVRIGHQSSDSGKVKPASSPLTTVTTKNEHILVAPTLQQSGFGERKGQAPRVLDLQAPLGTVVAGGSKHALVAAWLARNNGTTPGKYNAGRPIDGPAGTITSKDTHGLAGVFLDKLHGSARAGQSVGDPAPTVTSGGGRGGGHAALVAAFLVKYYSQGGQWQGLGEPMHTIVSKGRFGLVTVNIRGEDYIITDIGMRMLQPRELARAQGFDDDYVFLGTKSKQIALIGNSVPPPVVEALVRAQFGLDPLEAAA